MPSTERYYQTHVFCCTNRRPDGHKEGCCASKGSESLRNYMKKRAQELGLTGETTEQAGQQKMRINGAGCLGRCAFGPCVVVYPEGVWYAPKSEADIDDILITHLRQGLKVERLLIPDMPSPNAKEK